MRTMLIFRGLPGSGKSTEAANMVRQEPNRWVRINRDDLRGMVVGPGNNPHAHGNRREAFIRNAKEQLIRQAFASDYDVILDDTHLIKETVERLHLLAQEIGDVKVIEQVLKVPIDICIQRDAVRPGYARVGEDIIRHMAQRAGFLSRQLQHKEEYYPPRALRSTIMQDENLPKAIICDLDGTLAIIGDRSPYDASRCDELDKPNNAVVQTVLAMHAQGAKIIFLSGRDEQYRPQTERFINQHSVPSWGALGADDIPLLYELHMRPHGDSRKDSIIKRELFDAHIAGKYNVLFVLDDRNQVVDLWRSMGLTCFQVAPGNF